MNIKGVGCGRRRSNYRERAVGAMVSLRGEFPQLTFFTVVRPTFWDQSYRTRAARRRRRGNRISDAGLE